MPSIVTRVSEPDAYSHFDAQTLRLVPCQHEGIAQWASATTKVWYAEICCYSSVGDLSQRSRSSSAAKRTLHMQKTQLKLASHTSQPGLDEQHSCVL